MCFYLLKNNDGIAWKKIQKKIQILLVENPLS